MYQHDNIKPYNTPNNKKTEVKNMFNDISKRYDLLNTILSFGIDKYWRRILIKKLSKTPSQKILDLATGTADVAIAIAKKTNATQIIGLDLSPK